MSTYQTRNRQAYENSHHTIENFERFIGALHINISDALTSNNGPASALTYCANLCRGALHYYQLPDVTEKASANNPSPEGFTLTAEVANNLHDLVSSARRYKLIDTRDFAACLNTLTVYGEQLVKKGSNN